MIVGVKVPIHMYIYFTIKNFGGGNFGEFAELQEIHQNFLVQNFPFYKSWYNYIIAR